MREASQDDPWTNNGTAIDIGSLGGLFSAS